MRCEPRVAQQDDSNDHHLQRYFDILDGFVLDELTSIIGFRYGSLALYDNGIEWIGDLIAKSEGELLAIPGIGQKRLDLVKIYLAYHGLRLNAPCRNWLDDRKRLAKEIKPQLPPDQMHR